MFQLSARPMVSVTPEYQATEPLHTEVYIAPLRKANRYPSGQYLNSVLNFLFNIRCCCLLADIVLTREAKAKDRLKNV